MGEWVLSSTFARVGKYTAPKYAPSKKRSFIVACVDKSVPVTPAWSDELLEKWRKKNLFAATCDMSTKPQELAVKGDEPQISIVQQVGEQHPRMLKYVLKGEDKITDAKQVADFVQKFFDKKLKAVYKSATAPEQMTDAKGLTTLVGDTFEQMVFDAKK